MKTFFVVMLVLTPLSIYALTCDQSNPHPSANFCLTQGCEPGDRQCERCCEKNCLTCHDDGSALADLSDPTPWNPTGTQMDVVYPEETAGTTVTIADVCGNCHTGNPEEDRFNGNHNHPVDILYEGSDRELASDPEGLLLVCEQGSSSCLVRCVTCHQLHPVSNESWEEAGLLRAANQGSALCLICHKK